jgi:hypothetical protein
MRCRWTYWGVCFSSAKATPVGPIRRRDVPQLLIKGRIVDFVLLKRERYCQHGIDSAPSTEGSGPHQFR